MIGGPRDTIDKISDPPGSLANYTLMKVLSVQSVKPLQAPVNMSVWDLRKPRFKKVNKHSLFANSYYAQTSCPLLQKLMDKKTEDSSNIIRL